MVMFIPGGLVRALCRRRLDLDVITSVPAAPGSFSSTAHTKAATTMVSEASGRGQRSCGRVSHAGPACGWAGAQRGSCPNPGAIALSLSLVKLDDLPAASLGPPRRPDIVFHG